MKINPALAKKVQRYADEHYNGNYSQALSALCKQACINLGVK